jgi:flagellar biosynthesis protein FlhA
MANEAVRTAVRSSRLADSADIILGAAVVGIIAIMVLPMPPPLMDLLLTFSMTLGIVILLAAMYTFRPLDFSVFPSLLLMVTLFRLSLNVATARLILLKGDVGPAAAGQVVKAFGSFVVGGNYVVGLIIFAILTIINFVVITKGAGRIAEVAARFTLDAMPGKQMAIDADLNAGLIDENEARTRRREIAREADFYGAMDGASKFVRGDAVAGVIIILINIIGGLIIGVLQHGMDLAVAARTYTVLTVGDGLVTQIPALVVSTAAGIIVSRAASESEMSRQFSLELTRNPRVLTIAGGIILLFSFMPGLPKLPFMILGGIVFFGGLSLAGKRKRAAEEEVRSAEKKAAAAPPGLEPVEALLPLDVLELEVGYGLIPLVDEAQNGELLERIRAIRRQFVLESGFIVPPMHVRDNLQLKAGEYAVLIKGIEIARVELMLGHYLAMDPGDAKKRIEGLPTQEPAFHLPALWIPEARKEEAQYAGYTVVDPATVIATHLTELIRTHADELLSRQDVQKLIDGVAKTNPKVIEELLPGLLNVGQVQKVLQNLLRERVSIRDMQTILETLADHARLSKDPDFLTEYVRQRLARSIVRQYETASGELPVMTLSQEIEDQIASTIKDTDVGSYLTLDPQVGQKILKALTRAVENLAKMNHQPVVLCSPLVRRHLRKLTERFLPNLVTLSHSEITPTTRLKLVGEVGLSHVG